MCLALGSVTKDLFSTCSNKKNKNAAASKARGGQAGGHGGGVDTGSGAAGCPVMEQDGSGGTSGGSEVGRLQDADPEGQGL